MTDRLRFAAMLASSSTLLFVGGCLLTQSLDGYSGGSVLADGGASVDSGVSEDASDVGDALPTGDAISGLDASSGPFCSALSFVPTFCTDFDNGAFGTPWTVVDSSGVLQLASNPFVSSPSALRSHTDAVSSPAGKYVYAFLQHLNKTTFVTTADLSFDWYFDGASFAGVNSNVFSQLSLHTEHAYDLQFRVDSLGALTLAEVATTTHSYPLGTVQPKTWYRIQLAYSRTAKTATVSVNGNQVLGSQILVDSASASNGYEWRLGSNTRAPTAVVDMVIDNAVITIK